MRNCADDYQQPAIVYRPDKSLPDHRFLDGASTPYPDASDVGACARRCQQIYPVCYMFSFDMVNRACSLRTTTELQATKRDCRLYAKAYFDKEDYTTHVEAAPNNKIFRPE